LLIKKLKGIKPIHMEESDFISIIISSLDFIDALTDLLIKG